MFLVFFEWFHFRSVESLILRATSVLFFANIPQDSILNFTPIDLDISSELAENQMI